MNGWGQVLDYINQNILFMNGVTALVYAAISPSRQKGHRNPELVKSSMIITRQSCPWTAKFDAGTLRMVKGFMAAGEPLVA